MSNNGWPIVLLGEALLHRKEFVQIDESAAYKRCRVQLHAKGIVLRDILEGSAIKTKKQQVCRAGEFLVAEIDAKLGGYGIVPDDLENAIVSSHYFLFEIDTGKLDRSFLGYFIRTPQFFEQVAAQGSTNYAAIRPAHVLGYRVPLPPLAEQRRIVAKIDQLAAKIAEARGLREVSCETTDSLMAAACKVAFANGSWRWRTVDETVGRENLRNGNSPKSTTADCQYRCLRLSALDGGRFNCRDAKPVPISEKEAEPYLVRNGDVFVMRGNGSRELVGRAGMVTDAPANVIFPDLLIRVPLAQTDLLPAFFVRYWNSPRNREEIEDSARTTSGIWKVNQGHIAAARIPEPTLDEQRRIVAYLDALQAKVDRLKDLQTQTAAELDALLPSILDQAFKGEL